MRFGVMRSVTKVPVIRHSVSVNGLTAMERVAVENGLRKLLLSLDAQARSN